MRFVYRYIFSKRDISRERIPTKRPILTRHNQFCYSPTSPNVFAPYIVKLTNSCWSTETTPKPPTHVMYTHLWWWRYQTQAHRASSWIYYIYMYKVRWWIPRRVPYQPLQRDRWICTMMESEWLRKRNPDIYTRHVWRSFVPTKPKAKDNHLGAKTDICVIDSTANRWNCWLFMFLLYYSWLTEGNCICSTVIAGCCGFELLNVLANALLYSLAYKIYFYWLFLKLT